MSFVIAGERSGVGKTTITLSILASMVRRGCDIQSFKVGPDYIDPMFHSAVTGRPCRNLDPVLTSEDYVKDCFETHASRAEFSLVEGVMGLFDGAMGDRDWASTAHIAKLLNLPVVLVIDCGKLSRSVAAIVHGYCSLDPALNVVGVILNHVSGDRHRELLKQALAPLNVRILGILGRHEPIELPDRYLGLIPTDELHQFEAIQDSLADLGDRCLDWTALMPLLKTKSYMQLSSRESAFNLLHSPPQPPNSGGSDWEDPQASGEVEPIRIAIARDAAFNFYYEDNLDRLREQGATLVFWSPLKDSVPENIHGLILGGGFPEQFAARLSQNEATRKTLKTLIHSGLPTYAECGGLMYLCKKLITFDQQAYPMVGAISNQVQMLKKLSLGYRQVTKTQKTQLFDWSEPIHGHEFHHSQLLHSHAAPALELSSLSQPDRPSFFEGFGGASLHVSYVHLHWGNKPFLAEQFCEACRRYANSQQNGRL